MANEILYQCSNCGKTGRTRAMLGVPDGMFYAGYRAHGDVLYCPDCGKTWLAYRRKPKEEHNEAD